MWQSFKKYLSIIVFILLIFSLGLMGLGFIGMFVAKSDQSGYLLLFIIFMLLSGTFGAAFLFLSRFNKSNAKI
jgi:hypothetical protein